jgi:hypothetical protein
MVKYTVVPALAAAAALAVAAAPPIAGAAPVTPANVNYNVTFRGMYGPNQFPSEGTLALRTYRNGIVQGFYRPEGIGDFIPVTGGETGKNIWFDIGNRGAVHVSGKIEHGNIVGSAYANDDVPYRFNAVPSAVKSIG